MIVLIKMYDNGQQYYIEVDTDNPPAWLGGIITLIEEQKESEDDSDNRR